MIRLGAAIAATGFALVSPAAIAQIASLGNPSTLYEAAPAAYRAKFDTSKGVFVLEVHRDWAPKGADRFYNLVKNGFYDNVRFFRVISGFMVQFGINGDSNISAPWREAKLRDDPVVQSNQRGYITFAMAGPDTRTTQVFINLGENGKLDSQGFAPFGRVILGMEVVDKLHAEYGEGGPRGRGPDQGRVQMEGNAYLMRDFPNLDFIRNATIEKPSSPDAKLSNKSSGIGAAAEPTNAEAQYKRGVQYYNGQGVLQNYNEAAKWFRLAASQGHRTAGANLGSMFELGQGVPQDNVRAHVWYNLVGDVGSRQDVATRMSSTQITLAQEMAQKCKASNFKKCDDVQVRSAPTPPRSSSNAELPQAPKEFKKSSGTGFFVSVNGHLVTNFHVVDGCQTLKATELNGSSVVARVVQVSRNDDLALLQANIKPNSVASFRGSTKISQGETVTAYGFPLSGLLSSSGNVSTGLITALSGLRDNGRQMQISAPVQPGNSGGPLVDATGAVIGVVVAKLNAVAVARITSDIPQNVNFAIKMSAVINLLDASGVDYKTASSTTELPITEIAKQMKAYTVFIECN